MSNKKEKHFWFNIILFVIVLFTSVGVVDNHYQLDKINDGLDRFNQEQPCEPCTCSEQQSYQPQSSQTPTLTEQADYMTQEEAISHWNDKNQVMLSAPGFYSIIKDGNEEDISSLKQTCKDLWVVTSTRIIYDEDNLEAEIIHNINSTVTASNSIKVKIPELWGTIEENSETEAYLQALFDTTDDIKTITSNLKKFGDDGALYSYTPSQTSRAERPTSSFRLSFYVSGFRLDGISWFVNYEGSSFGVLLDSEPKARSKVSSKIKVKKATFDNDKFIGQISSFQIDTYIRLAEG